MVYDHLEPHGSDPEPIYVQAGTRLIPRWHQTCKKCGKQRYTEKTKTKQVGPDFD
jgi:hypothetical protein